MIRQYKAEIESVVVMALLAYAVYWFLVYITSQTGEPSIDLFTQILRAAGLQ